MYCKNCGAQIHGNYCSECGAKATKNAENGLAIVEIEELPPETAETYPSCFTGGAIARSFRKFVVRFVSLITLGLAFPAMKCWFLRWQCSRTFYNGRKLVFDGTGAQLFGKYMLWAFLTVITLGIYFTFAVRLKMVAWQTQHTHFEGVEPSEEEDKKSKFTGTALQLFGVNFLANFVTVITLTFGRYWAHCYKERWYCKHKVIDGRELYFDGKAGQYFGKCLLWSFLTVITFGIYAFWLIVKQYKWTVSHIKIADPCGLPQPEVKTVAEIEQKTKKPKTVKKNRTATGALVLCFIVFALIGAFIYLAINLGSGIYTDMDIIRTIVMALIIIYCTTLILNIICLTVDIAGLVRSVWYVKGKVRCIFVLVWQILILGIFIASLVVFNMPEMGLFDMLRELFG